MSYSGAGERLFHYQFYVQIKELLSQGGKRGHINLLITGWVLSAIKNATSANRQEQIHANPVLQHRRARLGPAPSSPAENLGSVTNSCASLSKSLDPSEPTLQTESKSSLQFMHIVGKLKETLYMKPLSSVPLQSKQ